MIKFNEDLATIHGYLCGDGCVVKNPINQTHIYYRIDFRNTNLTLLKDFQKRFERYFNLKPIIYRNERAKVHSKEIYSKLINEFGSFYSNDWKIPKQNEKNLARWLRAFFDCDSWVEDKYGTGRMVRVESINLKGLQDIQRSLKKYKIDSKIKKRNRKDRTIWRLNICGLENLKKFYKEIGFTHPIKKSRLFNAIKLYNTNRRLNDR